MDLSEIPGSFPISFPLKGLPPKRKKKIVVWSHDLFVKGRDFFSQTSKVTWFEYARPLIKYEIGYNNEVFLKERFGFKLVLNH